MAFFQMPRFLRRFIRRKMHPMAEKKAWDVKSRLSIIYAVVAWNALGIVCYQIFKGNKSWPITMGIRDPVEDTARPAAQWAHALGLNQAKVVRVKNLSQVSQVDEVVINRPAIDIVDNNESQTGTDNFNL